MKRWAILGLALGMSAGAHAASSAQWTLTQAQWSGVTSATQVLAVKPLHAAIAAFDAMPGSRLVVIHNGGEDGLFWAGNLKGWLVALGVPSTRIVDRIGAIAPDKIRLQVEPASGS
ncbi:MAG: hypothetical protein ACRETC_08660 [Gammaproteobacteria bacterium]